MIDTKHQGMMTMVQIDGGKVKQLREQNGLTQLYVATVVQVTTDTISRWENKRYPTIKKENALRLAEALEVDLEAILETEHQEDSENPQPADDPPATAPISDKSLKNFWPLPAALLAICVLIAVTSWFFLKQQPPLQISAKRMLPLQCSPGQRFPVTIEVIAPPEASVAIILKEQLPKDVKIHKTNPSIAQSGQKNNTLKWLHKVEGRVLFTYIASISKPLSESDTFSGTIAASNNSGTPVAINGNTTITLGNHHWADSDGDNSISDTEILTVYDQYGDIEKLGIDLDLIEEIWLGSGYRWDAASKTYKILP
jgi:transcriptional regulator with XRE-family HTH domain